MAVSRLEWKVIMETSKVGFLLLEPEVNLHRRRIHVTYSLILIFRASNQVALSIYQRFPIKGVP
jgi:hypothetical protein